MTYADRYHLTPEQSRFLAKKKWDENVYCGMKMENRAVTFPQTKTILEGVNVPGVQLDDIQAILNMRDAWRFLIGSIDEDVTLEYVCKLNGFIARNEALEWGKLRTGSVAISGTDYTPPVPQEAAVREALAAILSADTTATERALNAFCWGTRGQLFWDGNKRTSAEVVADNVYFGESKRRDGDPRDSYGPRDSYAPRDNYAARDSYGQRDSRDSAPRQPAPSAFAELDDGDGELPF